MPDLADQAEIQEQLARQIAIDNRVQNGKWDGLPRECYECFNLINDLRLKAINATLCITCASINEKNKGH